MTAACALMAAAAAGAEVLHRRARARRPTPDFLLLHVGRLMVGGFVLFLMRALTP